MERPCDPPHDDGPRASPIKGLSTKEKFNKISASEFSIINTPKNTIAKNN